MKRECYRPPPLLPLAPCRPSSANAWWHMGHWKSWRSRKQRWSMKEANIWLVEADLLDPTFVLFEFQELDHFVTFVSFPHHQIFEVIWLMLNTDRPTSTFQEWSMSSLKELTACVFVFLLFFLVHVFVLTIPAIFLMVRWRCGEPLGTALSWQRSSGDFGQRPGRWGEKTRDGMGCLFFFPRNLKVIH